MKKPTEQVPKEPAVRRAWILYQLKIRGVTMRDIADEEGVSDRAVAAALLSPSSYLEKAIAAKLGMTACELFSDRFTACGKRLNRTKPRNRSSLVPAHNVENGGAL